MRRGGLLPKEPEVRAKIALWEVRCGGRLVASAAHTPHAFKPAFPAGPAPSPHSVLVNGRPRPSAPRDVFRGKERDHWSPSRGEG